MIGSAICEAFEAKLSKVIEQVSLDYAHGRTPLMCIAGLYRCSSVVSFECLSLCFHVSVQLGPVVGSRVKCTMSESVNDSSCGGR